MRPRKHVPQVRWGDGGGGSIRLGVEERGHSAKLRRGACEEAERVSAGNARDAAQRRSTEVEAVGGVLADKPIEGLVGTAIRHGVENKLHVLHENMREATCPA